MNWIKSENFSNLVIRKLYTRNIKKRYSEDKANIQFLLIKCLKLISEKKENLSNIPTVTVQCKK